MRSPTPGVHSRSLPCAGLASTRRRHASSRRRSRSGRLAPAAIALALAACGDDEVVEEVLPTADEARAYFGLTPGTCVRYRFQDLQFATAQVTGPNQASIPGRSVYEWTFSLPGGGLADTWFIEAQDDGELRLLRYDTSIEVGGQPVRQSKAYPSGQEPVLLRLRYDAQGVPVVQQGDRYDVRVTPMVSAGTEAPEQHVVVIQDVDAEVPTPEGTSEGVNLLYTQTVGSAGDRSVLYRLVPGRAFAQIRDGGATYQSCAWRTCDLAGTCSGPPTCAELTCN